MASANKPRKSNRASSSQTNSWGAVKSIFLRAISAGPFAMVTVCVTATIIFLAWVLGSANLTTVILKVLDSHTLGLSGWLFFALTTIVLNVNRKRHSIELDRVTNERNELQARFIQINSSTENPKLAIGKD